MVGAFVGDINGSIYEYNNSPKTKDFELWQENMYYTDDTVATIAVMDALLKRYPIDYSRKGLEKVKEEVINSFVEYVRAYPSCGWGAYFESWATNYYNNGYRPYNSFGNGAAMRISPVGWIAESEVQVKLLSSAVTGVTHNHPEGLKGAEATAMCIYLARKGKTKEVIKKYVLDNYYPEMNLLDYKNLLENYEFDITCQGTVPVAIYAFLISKSFEDCIRTAVSIGGDCDTLTCIACSIAEAFYGKTKDLSEYKRKAFEYLPDFLINIINDFNSLLYRIAFRVGYLVNVESEDELNELTNFLRTNNVTVAPCKFDKETYNVISISEDKKYACKKTMLSFTGEFLKKMKVRFFNKPGDFIKEFK